MHVIGCGLLVLLPVMLAISAVSSCMMLCIHDVRPEAKGPAVTNYLCLDKLPSS